MKQTDKKWDSDYHFSHDEEKVVSTSTDSGERASDECCGDYSDNDIEYLWASALMSSSTVLPPPFYSKHPSSFSAKWDFLANPSVLDK